MTSLRTPATKAHAGAQARARITVQALALLGLAAVAVAAPAQGITRLASGPSPFVAGCEGVPDLGQVHANAEVEPFVAVNPSFPLNLVGVWQQDRWSTGGGAHGLGTAYSFDGGLTWRRVFVPFSRCAGGNTDNNGNYERATDPWVSFSPNGVAHQMALSLNNFAKPGGTASAMLASRSTDGGRTWSTPVTLVADPAARFNDKNTITADPTDARYVYAAWDRLSFVPGEGVGPTLFARSVDNGASWEPARIIFDPGLSAQTIGNRIEVLPDGTLVNLFTHIDYLSNAVTAQVIRSSDKGATWSAPVKVADMFLVTTVDPDTGTQVRDGNILAQLAVSPRDGTLHVVWQDGRFSAYQRSGIALSRSTDGGLTWSEPVQVNHDPQVAAFTPSVHVRFDGTVGVSYYDFRSNTPDPANLPTDYWLARSRNGQAWRESRISDTFDLAKAPLSGGLFLGDYQGLASIGPVFVPFYVKTTPGSDTGNRNDVYAHLALGAWVGMGAAVQQRDETTRRQDEADEALPTYSTQGTERAPLPAQALLWHQQSMAVAQRVLPARLPEWAQTLHRARREGGLGR